MSGQVMPRVPDGASYPYVLDLEGVWHLRPDTDEWATPLGHPERPQAQAVCGQEVYSTRVSSHEPHISDIESDAQRLCPGCALAKEHPLTATRHEFDYGDPAEIEYVCACGDFERSWLESAHPADREDILFDHREHVIECVRDRTMP